MEGGLRAPCLVRWPQRVGAGRASNEIVHVTDLFTTLATVGGAGIPSDRPIDGVDQLDFFLGTQTRSNREGFVFYIKQELRAAKWRNWKMHLIWEAEPNAGPNHLESPLLFNLVQDPKEETDLNTTASWARTPIRRMIQQFQDSLKNNPPTAPGAPDDYTPQTSRMKDEG